MRFFTGIGLLFYVLIISASAGAAILFVSQVFLLEDVVHYLTVAYSDPQIRGIVASISSALIFLSFIFARIIAGGRQKERTIAFDNPSGRVSVSLSAVEDLVKRLMYRMFEVKEARLHIIATKKGIEVEARLTLRADVNIPETTARLQDLIKSKIHEMLGVEEQILVRMHVVKIVTEEGKAKRAKGDTEEKTEPTPIPFHGYRR